MKINNQITLAVAMITATTALSASPALSHSFNVALVLPGPVASLPQARQMRQGFMLATTERDAHANEESDGHLGGLDSYVRQVDKPENLDADIVVLLGSKQTTSAFSKQINPNDIAILIPGKSPFSDTTNPAVARFIASYKSAYGTAPSAAAGQGYNAARRVAAAIRAQGSADDKGLLNENFKQTADSFTW